MEQSRSCSATVVVPLPSLGSEAGRSVLLQQYERCIVYLELLAQRFPEQRATVLRQLAQAQKKLGEKYYEMLDDGHAERCQELAEEALRESLAIEDSFQAHISLAEFLIDPDEEFDEAEDHLMQAKALTTDPADLSHIEMHLGEIAMGREQYEEALEHYQYVVDHDPDLVDSWLDIAEAYKKLGNLAEADASYRRAIELEPENEDLYYDLSKLYAENKQPAKAMASRPRTSSRKDSSGATASTSRRWRRSAGIAGAVGGPSGMPGRENSTSPRSSPGRRPRLINWRITTEGRGNGDRDAAM